MRWFFGTLVAAVIALAVYAGSAVTSLARLAEAAKAGNAAEVMQRTDMPRLRRSLSAQIVQAYLEQIGPSNPRKTWLANTVGVGVADALLEKLLTEENVAKLLQSGSVPGINGTPARSVPSLGTLGQSQMSDLIGRVEPVTAVEFRVRLSAEARGDDFAAINLHFDGSGWKLAGLTLPKAVVREYARSIQP